MPQAKSKSKRNSPPHSPSLSEFDFGADTAMPAVVDPFDSGGVIKGIDANGSLRSPHFGSDEDESSPLAIKSLHIDNGLHPGRGDSESHSQVSERDHISSYFNFSPPTETRVKPKAATESKDAEFYEGEHEGDAPEEEAKKPKQRVQAKKLASVHVDSVILDKPRCTKTDGNLFAVVTPKQAVSTAPMSFDAFDFVGNAEPDIRPEPARSQSRGKTIPAKSKAKANAANDHLKFKLRSVQQEPQKGDADENQQDEEEAVPAPTRRGREKKVTLPPVEDESRHSEGRSSSTTKSESKPKSSKTKSTPDKKPDARSKVEAEHEINRQHEEYEAPESEAVDGGATQQSPMVDDAVEEDDMEDATLSERKTQLDVGRNDRGENKHVAEAAAGNRDAPIDVDTDTEVEDEFTFQGDNVDDDYEEGTKSKKKPAARGRGRGSRANNRSKAAAKPKASASSGNRMRAVVKTNVAAAENAIIDNEAAMDQSAFNEGENDQSIDDLLSELSRPTMGEPTDDFDATAANGEPIFTKQRGRARKQRPLRSKPVRADSDADIAAMASSLRDAIYSKLAPNIATASLVDWFHAQQQDLLDVIDENNFEDEEVMAFNAETSQALIDQTTAVSTHSNELLNNVRTFAETTKKRLRDIAAKVSSVSKSSSSEDVEGQLARVSKRLKREMMHSHQTAKEAMAQELFG